MNEKRQALKASRDVKNRSLKGMRTRSAPIPWVIEVNGIGVIKSLRKNYFRPKILHPVKLLFECESKIPFNTHELRTFTSYTAPNNYQ